ncbi:hypothetical protein [Streptomyces goshikiensis]|uniref:hypothetical protein n=1 Tax=Streptomyces goshikiensis TaxID=1942 RepID=UPI0036AC03F5
MEHTHFTAWLVNAPSCLDQGCMDVTVLQDRLIGGDPGNDEDWVTDSSKPQAFYSVTTVDAREGTAADGIGEAEKLMGRAGWKVTGEWEALPNTYIATVQRVA